MSTENSRLEMQQQERPFRAELPPGTDLFLLSMRAEEGLSHLFRFELTLVSESEDIDLEELLEKPVTVTAESDSTRYFHGLIAECEYLGMEFELFRYRVVLRPQLWFLSHTSDCRIFQEKTVPDIVRQLAQEQGMVISTAGLSESYPARAYCVQYRESTRAFICRLLEEEGIYYFFKHERGKHTLNLADSRSAHVTDLGGVAYQPPGSERRKEYVYAWTVARSIRSAKYVISDYDFVKPATSLLESHNEKEPGSYELYDFPGEYTESSDGRRYAKVRIEENQADRCLARGRCNHSKWASGALFTLQGNPRADQDKEYLIVSVYLSLGNPPYESGDTATDLHFEVDFTVLEAAAPYRPPRITPRPVVGGPQTAVVVGPSGEEIHTDEHGRVKLHFHWDRHDKKDQDSSCWIRVAQLWAGKRWGGIWLPRIGDEVIVDFLEGDPDQPIVTGRVYNGDNKPPYALPANKTQSGLISNSSKDGSKSNANELRFEDKKDSEQVYFHAEKDFERVVENDDTLKIGFDKKDPGDQKIDIYNHRTTTLDQGNDKLQVKTGNRTILIDKGNHDLTVEMGDHSINVNAGKSTILAMQSIELKVGPSTIKLTPSSIEIKSPMIRIRATGMAELKSSMTTVSGDGLLTLKGGIVMIN